MASPENIEELRAAYVRWCLDRLAEDRLCTAQVPEEFRVLSEPTDDRH